MRGSFLLGICSKCGTEKRLRNSDGSMFPHHCVNSYVSNAPAVASQRPSLDPDVLRKAIRVLRGVAKQVDTGQTGIAKLIYYAAELLERRQVVTAACADKAIRAAEAIDDWDRKSSAGTVRGVDERPVLLVDAGDSAGHVGVLGGCHEASRSSAAPGRK